MNTRQIAVVSLSAAALFGLAAAGASAAQAAVVAPTSAIFVTTDPPGPCLTSELGQRKRGPDGQIYECQIVDTSNTDTSDTNTSNT